jgi:hypothetical protein
MPDGRTHKLVGAGTGAVYAAYRAKEESTPHWWIEVAGGALGGYAGGIFPDVLEPAVSSWHRGTAHSYATGSGIVAVKNGLKAFGEACRENAENCKAIQMISEGNIFVPAIPDPFSLLLSKIFELLWRFLAGFVNGFAAGYVSHLALDATIGKRSIPLLTRGF